MAAPAAAGHPFLAFRQQGNHLDVVGRFSAQLGARDADDTLLEVLQGDRVAALVVLLAVMAATPRIPIPPDLRSPSIPAHRIP